MRTILLLVALCTGLESLAQVRCETALYEALQRTTDADNVTRGASSEPSSPASPFMASTVIRIPVVVHVVWKDAAHNISDAQIISQIEALNKDFRRKNTDAANTPERFRSLAADAQIEFYLATADPQGRPTTGIVRKQTNLSLFMSNDRVKYSSQGGSDAWDTKTYLNIWTCNLISGIGYSSVPGGDAAKDGVVIQPSAMGTVGSLGGFNLGRTATHEIGHWLGLKHIWGDAQCGDDGVHDTPQQAYSTINCPSGVQRSCGNNEAGNMYMNFMDYTPDACMNLFTEGQKQKMRSLFVTGGTRAAMLQSKGLSEPWAQPDMSGDSKETASVYPNPATTQITVLFSKDDVGKTVNLFAANGGLAQRITVTQAQQTININSLKPGLYFIKAGKATHKFIKL